MNQISALRRHLRHHTFKRRVRNASIAAVLLGLLTGSASSEPPPGSPALASANRTLPVSALSEAVVFTVNDSTITPYTIGLARQVGADMMIRGWFKWFGAPPLDSQIPLECRRFGSLFGGGITCSVIFEEEKGLSPEQISDMATKGIDGKLIPWPPGPPRSPYGHHGSLSCDAYLDYLFRWCRDQIDAGVDSLFMDESDAALLPDEGYDDHSIRDFASFLGDVYSPTSGWEAADARWQFVYQIDLKNSRQAPTGSVASFNYRAYLQEWHASEPADVKDPLAAAWKEFRHWRDNRAWHLLTDRIRSYARDKGRLVTICGNGLFPYVDLQVTNNWKEDEQIERAGTIDLTENGIPRWRSLVLQGQSIAGKPVPVVVFHDWGASLPWLAAPVKERQIWMRTRGAEIYAAGGFFAFPVYAPYGCDAGKDGSLPTITRQAAFYHAHPDYYLHTRFLGAAAIESPAKEVSVALSSTADSRTVLLQVINRQFHQGDLLPQHDVALAVRPLDQPASAVAVSPDWDGERPIACTTAAGRLTLALPSLDAYAVIALRFNEPLTPAALSMLVDRK